MIDINLIPPAMRKDAGKDEALAINISKEIILGVGGGLLILIVLVHLLLGVVWLTGLSRLSFYNARWQEVAPDKVKIDAINKEAGDIKKKINMISDMTVDKTVLWSPKFNAISDAVPKGLWIRRMMLDGAGLTIEGSVVSKNQNEITNIGAFLSALKQNNDFMKDFSSLEENSIHGAHNKEVEVTDFSVMAKLKK